MIIAILIPILIFALYKIYIFEYHLPPTKQSYKPDEYYFKIGEKFEDFVRFNHFGSNYEAIHVTPSYEENCMEFNNESFKPDLKMMDSITGEEFWVECKYRSYTHHKKEYQVISEKQLRRHRNIIDSPVFVMLGIGGKPNKPLYLYKIPIAQCKPVMNIGHLYYQFQINK